MSKCPDCGQDHPEVPEGSGHYEPMMVEAHVFGGGLSEEQKEGLERIMDCVDRAQQRMENMFQGNDPVLKEQYSALYRLLYGISDSAAIPIAALVAQGTDPITAIKSVMAGIGGMMFLAGWEFGLHESTPEERRRPVQPMREKTVALSKEDDDKAQELLASLSSLPDSIDYDSED